MDTASSKAVKGLALKKCLKKQMSKCIIIRKFKKAL